MNKNDKMMAVFNPPDGIRMTEKQRELIGKELAWKAVWSDPDRVGHWLMCPVGVVARGSEEENCNTVTSAYLNQTQAMAPAEYEFNIIELAELDRRIAVIQEKRDRLASKIYGIPAEYGKGLKEHSLSSAIEESVWTVGSNAGEAPIEELMQPEPDVNLAEAYNSKRVMEELIAQRKQPIPVVPGEMPVEEIFEEVVKEDELKLRLKIIRAKVDEILQTL